MAAPVQGSGHRSPVWAAMPVLLAPLALGLSACGTDNPLMTPVGWWHDLSGGAIAADRPPPPGQDLPYPHIYSIPPKPVLPSAGFREMLETQLAQERDDQERLAAHSPIVVEKVPPPPPPAPPPPDAAGNAPESTTANATLPAAEPAPPPPAKPAPAPQAAPIANDGGPPTGAPLVIAGLPQEEANLPNVPDAPPQPATFEGMPAEPAPTPPPRLPAHVPLAAEGVAVLFAPDSAVLDASQDITVKDVAARRGKSSIEVEGHGQAGSDSPAGQESALDLGLKRAQAVAKQLETEHVPAQAIRVSATAFGSGASLRLAP